MMKYVKFAENYCLLTQTLKKDEPTIEVNQPIDFIFKIDVSGSMTYDLPLIREQLKNKLPILTKLGDTVTIIWFSGPRESGILLETVEIKSLKTFTDINNSIDKWLRPVGMTAFKEPFVLMKEVIERIKTKRPNPLISSIFLSDGGNNSVSWTEVIGALKNVESDLSACTIVEYGYYCDSQKLTEMAGILGGEKVSCEGFQEYDIVFEKKLTSTISGGKKNIINIKNDHLYDFAFSVSNDGSVLLYNINDKKQIMVNSDINEIHYFSSNIVGDEHFPETALYAALYILADQLKFDDNERILYKIGDNYHYKMLLNAYGKQKLNSFKTSIKECVENPSKRFPEGKVDIKPIDENAYCLMYLFNDLGTNNCLFYPNHSSFKYNRIGRKKTAKGSELNEAEKKRLSEAKNVEEASQILKELEEKNVDLKFIDLEPNKGYNCSDLVYNESKANLSIRIRIDGNVILPKDNKYNITEIFSYKWRTYNLIKDGLLNIQNFPIGYNENIEKILVDNNVSFSHDLNVDTNQEFLIIDLNSLPIINKSMVRNISANDLGKLEIQLLDIQGLNKVYTYYRKSLFPKESTSFVESYGQEVADWLKEIGITDFNGFAPKTVMDVATDFYMSVVLDVKTKGVSSFPKVEDVVKKINENKLLKLNEIAMANAIIKYKEQTESDLYKSLSEEQQKEVLKTYLINKSNEINSNKRKLMQEKAQIVFSLILSRKWFKEFKTFEENQLTLNIDNNVYDLTFDLKEEKVEI